MDQDLDTSKIKNWRSITTLIVFVITNIIVLFPFNVPIYVPRWLCNATLDSLSALRIIPARKHSPQHLNKPRLFVRLKIPFNFVTAPLTAVFFLLAILAIGRQEVKDGTIGYLQISPIDIMAFFLTLAYIAISIDASGLIRWLAFKVLQKAGTVGHRLFFYLYAFFFALGSFLGNDPLILSGTAFLAYMTRVSSNIVHPRAWIHSQFAIANICSAILVSSNPTNLVLAGAFNIRFITYTANMIVPVVATAVVMFPFLLYIIFADESLIPLSIQMHELSDEAKARPPVNPNIPNARGTAEEQEEMDNENGQLLSLEEIMNPFLDKGGAAFGAVLMAATLITILSVNASSQTGHSKPVFYVTLPAAFIMFCWDLASGWINRKDTREIAARGRRAVEDAKAERERKESNRKLQEQADTSGVCQERLDQSSHSGSVDGGSGGRQSSNGSRALHDDPEKRQSVLEYSKDVPFPKIRGSIAVLDNSHQATIRASPEPLDESPTFVVDEEKRPDLDLDETNQPKTLVSISKDLYRWLQETFPTVTVVLSHLPFPLVPFALAMFVLVQALVTKGWVPVFAYGWDHWVNKTGTVGAIGGMGFLSVILCNFAGTNIGTTILLCRVIQAWQTIHNHNKIPISDRTFWATVYSMALGVNYGAFSTAFSASLAGLLWRDILRRKHIRVGSIEFARVNLPIIAISMAVGCIVLVGQVYIMRKTTPYE